MKIKAHWIPILMALFFFTACKSSNKSPAETSRVSSPPKTEAHCIPTPAFKCQVSTLAGQAGAAGFANGVGTQAKFNHPTEMALSADKSILYLSDFENHVIRKIVIATGEVTTIAGKAGVAGIQDGVGTNATFNSPGGITRVNNKLYVVEFGSHRVRQVNLATMQVSGVAGVPDVAGDQDGAVATAQFLNPEGISYANNILYITEFGGHKIRALDLTTNQVSTIAGSTIAGAADGIGAQARFNQPTRAIPVGDFLYVADYGNHALRKINLLTSEVTTFAGQLGAVGSVDGQGKDARLQNVAVIATDGTFLYIGSYISNVIRKVELATAEVTTIAGVAYQAGTRDGNADQALFNNIAGIAYDGSVLYVSDYSGHVVRKLE